MPTLKQIYDMMEAQETPYIRIYNTNKERIFIFENDTVEATKAQMESLMPYISSYGKIIVEAANQKAKNANYATSYKWNCTFDNAVATVGQPQLPINPFQVPAGYVSQDLMQKELQIINLKMDYERQLREKDEQLRAKDKEDPIGMIEKFGPLVLYAMGKNPAEIQQIGQLYKGGAIAGSQTQTGHTLTFSDVKNLPDKEKEDKCQSLADELAKYISIEHMILLQEGLIKKLKQDPKVIETILMYI